MRKAILAIVLTACVGDDTQPSLEELCGPVPVRVDDAFPFQNFTNENGDVINKPFVIVDQQRVSYESI